MRLKKVYNVQSLDSARLLAMFAQFARFILSQKCEHRWKILHNDTGDGGIVESMSGADKGT